MEVLWLLLPTRCPCGVVSLKLLSGRSELRRRHTNCLNYHTWQVHESMTGWNHVKQFSLITWVFFSHGDFALAFMAVDAQSGESVVQCKMIRNETQEWDGGTEGQNILKCHKTWQNVTAMKMFCFLKWWIINMFICL